MKVCFITGEYPTMRGGVADYTEILATSLRSQGVEPWIITSAKASPQASSSLPVFPIIGKWGFGAWRRIEGLLREKGAEIAHIQYQTAAYGMHPAINLLPFWLHRRLQCRVVVTLHDLREPYLFPKAGRLRRWVNARLVKDSDAAILTNEEDLAEVQQLAPSAPLSLIPIGSNVPSLIPPGFDRNAQRHRMGVGSEQYLLCYFGLLNQSKGVEFLLDALRLLLDSDVPVKLLMLGEEVGEADPTNRAYREKVLAMIEKSGLLGVVVRTGYLPKDELSVYLHASDTCVLPFADGASFRRGSLLAALAHGLPIITTRSSAPQGRACSLVDGENCLLVPPGDAKALAEAVEKLIGSPALRAHLGEGALALSGEFSWEKIVEKTVQLYGRLSAD